MLNGRSVLGIIPARGGSKGLPRKNILTLKNKPMIAWTIEAGLTSKYIDRLILSSDDEEIIEIAKAWNCEVPFVRPKTLAEDNTSSIDVIMHGISQLEKQYDYIVLLQPTSPMRNSADIDTCLSMLVNNDPAFSCVSVCEVDKSPFWMYHLDDTNNLLKPFLQGDKSYTRRQDMPSFFMPNGAIYVADRLSLLKEQTFITNNTYAYKMPKDRSIDIDSPLDFAIAEFLMQRNTAL